MKPIYLDYAATTPVDPRVAEKMSHYLMSEGCFGNPDSRTHDFGEKAREAVEKARGQVADLIGASADSLIWCSGATESINLALKGAASLYQHRGKHIVTLKTEHKAVLDTCQYLEKQGFQVTYLNPEKNGVLDLNKLESALRTDTFLVSIMHVNNEIGVIQDIVRIAELTSKRHILLHVDAAQSIGKIPIRVEACPIDLLSMSAHKCYGPKGIGALYLRQKPRVRVAPQLHGGGHERGMRSGTLATHQIVGMGEAYELARKEMLENTTHLFSLRDQLHHGLQNIKNIFFNTDWSVSAPTILNVRFELMKANDLMMAMPKIAFSTGAACSSSQVEASYVLRALGLTEKESAHSARFSWGKFTTSAEIYYLLDKLSSILSSAP